MTACCQFRKCENNFGALVRKILTFILVVLSTVNLEAMAMSNEKKAEEQVGIILLHGAGLGSWIWEKVIPELKSKSIAIDLPGRAGKAATFRNSSSARFCKLRCTRDRKKQIPKGDTRRAFRVRSVGASSIFYDSRKNRVHHIYWCGYPKFWRGISGWYAFSFPADDLNLFMAKSRWT